MPSTSTLDSSPLDPALIDGFRGAMRRVASGVALVTTNADNAWHGIAMTAFMSLSFDPPSVAIAINRTASLYAPLMIAGRFCINVLDTGQADLCQDFVRCPVDTRFAEGGWTDAVTALPSLPDALSRIFCRVGGAQTFGSHAIVIGVVEQVINRDEIDPLIYADGRYGRLAPLPKR